MRERGPSALSCIGLVGLFLAQAALAGDDAGTAAAANGARNDAVEVSAPGGDLYVMSAREPDTGGEAQAFVDSITAPKSDALKAGPVEVREFEKEDLGIDAFDLALADPGVPEPAEAEPNIVVAELEEGAAPSAAAAEEDAAGEAMSESDLQAAPVKAKPGAHVQTLPDRAANAPVRVEVPAQRAQPEPEDPMVVAQADVVVTPESVDAPESSDALDSRRLPGRPQLAENPLAESTFERMRSSDGILRVLAGKSLILDLERSAKRVSVANPEVAEVLIISPEQVMINGLSNGETSIIVWDSKGNYRMNSLVVGDQLQDQVMLEVTVAEVNRTAAERHGVDVRAMGGQFGTVTQFGNAAPTSGSFPPREGEPLFPMGLDSGISWAVVDFKNDIAAFFEQIQRENLGRLLAEPKLLARSGKEANFLSGGEIPIVITQQQNTTIEFKEFGTKIKFVPEVREDGTIDLKVQSEVSEPDFANGVELFGFRVPAFVTRRVDTDVTLRSQESLVIAGLIKETKQELESKLPFVGDIPFLGYLFRSTEFEKDLLELVIVVRPKVVAPIAAGADVPLPTDRGPLTRQEVRTKAEKEKVSRPRPY
jgi:pilus assembly protein CpaC